jgi:N-methylhydantoinase B
MMRAQATPRLKELTESDFRLHYGCDRFTATVLANRFRYVVAHMSNMVIWHAFSPILKDAADMCGMLSGPPSLGFPMAAVSETLPLFYGSIPDAVRITLEEHGLERLRPGDLVLVNDPYRVGTHPNDVCCMRPVFFEGQLVGTVTIRAHLQDIGGIVPGGSEVTKRNTYEDGLRLPPILLYAAGEPVLSTFKFIYDNSRLGHLVVPDLKTINQALRLGEELLVESIGKYGMEAYAGAVRYVCDAADESMREALLTIPDGVYDGEEWIDGDGLPDSPEYVVRVRITKVGERAEFDLRGSSPASRTALNCGWPDIKTAIAFALKFLIEHRHPVNSGTLRSIDVVVPPGAILNPDPPHTCFFYHEVVMLILHAIYQALNPVLGPDAVPAGKQVATHHGRGTLPDGTEWPAVGAGWSSAGPWGATKAGDGDSGQQPIFQNINASGGVETVERLFPETVLRYEYLPDSGGPGTNRGGAANMQDEMCFYAIGHRFANLHAKRPAAGGGVFGGRAGSLPGAWLWDGGITELGTRPDFLPLTLKDPVYQKALPQNGLIDSATNQLDEQGEYVCTTRPIPASAGAISRVLCAGGGGWGDPLERDPERVKADVRDEYVSIVGAARDYGIVVVGDPSRHPERLAVDLEGTRQLRTELRRQRLPSQHPAR